MRLLVLVLVVTMWRRTSAIVRPRKQLAMPVVTHGQMAAGPVTPPQTRSILPVRRQILGVALRKPLTNASARSQRAFVAKPRERPGPMNAGLAAIRLLGAVSCQEMVQNRAATATLPASRLVRSTSRMRPGRTHVMYARIRRRSPMVVARPLLPWLASYQ